MTTYLDILSTLPHVPVGAIVAVILAAVVAVVAGDWYAVDKCQRAVATIDRRETIVRRLSVDPRASAAARAIGRARRAGLSVTRAEALLCRGSYSAALGTIGALYRHRSPVTIRDTAWAADRAVRLSRLQFEIGSCSTARRPSGLVAGL